MTIDGKLLASEKSESLKDRLKNLRTKASLAVILVGNDPSSKLYISVKQKKAEELGIDTQLFEFAEKADWTEISRQVKNLNEDKAINGILIQLPLPSKFKDQQQVLIDTIDGDKDVDCLTSDNLGRLFNGSRVKFYPAGVGAVLAALESVVSRQELRGKKVVIIGQSALIGKPLSIVLQQMGLTVISCNEWTSDLSHLTKLGEILISATGVPHLVKGEMVKPGAVVIDVGIAKVGDKIVGDVDFDEVSKIASAITPVPGGIGPLTVACLLENVVVAASGK